MNRGQPLSNLTMPIILIGLGVLFFVHMAQPAFGGAFMVGCFLILLGMLKLAQRLLPAPGLVRGSLFGPVVLIGLGVLFLLHGIISAARLSAFIAHYWPVLLILWGVARLLDHLQSPTQQRPRGMNGGEVVLLIFIIIFGLSFSGVYHYRDSQMARYWGIDPSGWNPFFESYTFNTAVSGAVAPGQSVVVRGYRGDVRVHAGGGQAINAQLSDVVKAASRDAAQRQFAAAPPAIHLEGGQVVVEPAGDQRDNNFDANLDLTLPPGTPLQIQSQNGDLTVNDWAANLTLGSTHGDIRVNRATGNVEVNSGHGDITLEGIGGTATIRGGGDDVTMNNIAGLATLEGEYTGALNFAQLAHGLVFNSSRTSFRVAQLPGTLQFDSGNLTLERGTEVHLRTRDESVTLREVAGPVEVMDRNDSVHIATTGAAADITVTTQNADIRLEMPAGSQFAWDLSARRGGIENEFGENVHDDGRLAESHGGSGPKVTLETTNGSITLHKN